MGTRDRKAKLAVLEKAHPPTAGLSYMQAQITNSKTSMKWPSMRRPVGVKRVLLFFVGQGFCEDNNNGNPWIPSWLLFAFWLHSIFSPTQGSAGECCLYGSLHGRFCHS